MESAVDTPEDPLVCYSAGDLEYLLEVTRCLTSIRQPEVLFQKVVEKAVELTRACRGYLFLLDVPTRSQVEKFDSFRCAASYRAAEWAAETGEYFVSKRSVLKAVNNKSSVQLESDVCRRTGAANHSLGSLGINSILVEPIVHQEKVLGVLYLDSRGERTFAVEHAAMMGSFTAQVAICLENVRLGQEREEAMRRQHQEQVKALEAKAAQVSLSSHLRMASHDLKGPLTSLRTGLALMRRRYSIPKDDPVLVDMELSMSRAVQLVVSYLDLEALNSGAELPLNHSMVDLGQVVGTEIRLVRSQLPPHRRDGLRFAVSISPGKKIWADRQRLSQIFYNLLSNAVKFSPLGTDIVVQHVDSPHSHLVSVTDQGPGLSAQARSEVLQAFKSPSGGDGHGLGLYLVKELVEAHKGKLEIESEPGAGTTIWLSFPKAT